jgi:hypothetical protein
MPHLRNFKKDCGEADSRCIQEWSDRKVITEGHASDGSE